MTRDPIYGQHDTASYYSYSPTTSENGADGEPSTDAKPAPIKQEIWCRFDALVASMGPDVDSSSSEDLDKEAS